MRIAFWRVRRKTSPVERFRFTVYRKLGLRLMGYRTYRMSQSDIQVSTLDRENIEDSPQESFDC